MSFGGGQLSSGGRQQLAERRQEVWGDTDGSSLLIPEAAAFVDGQAFEAGAVYPLDLWSGCFEERVNGLSADSRKELNLVFSVCLSRVLPFNLLCHQMKTFSAYLVWAS